jgi:3-ketoacyl-CoA synthase
MAEAQEQQHWCAGIVDNKPFDLSMDAAIAEMEMVIYSVVENTLQASNLGPSEVRSHCKDSMLCHTISKIDSPAHCTFAQMGSHSVTHTALILRCACQVDIFITATDTYVPVPSMSAMIANRFKMRSDVRTYSLGGHACTSGIIAVELAQQLLKVGNI